MQATREHKITLRMDRKTKRGIKSSADKNRRSINSEIIKAIEYYLANPVTTSKEANIEKAIK